MTRQNAAGRGASPKTLGLCVETRAARSRSSAGCYYVAWTLRLMLSMIEEALGFGGSRLALCGRDGESQAKPKAGLPGAHGHGAMAEAGVINLPLSLGCPPPRQ